MIENLGYLQGTFWYDQTQFEFEIEDRGVGKCGWDDLEKLLPVVREEMLLLVMNTRWIRLTRKMDLLLFQLPPNAHGLKLLRYWRIQSSDLQSPEKRSCRRSSFVLKAAILRKK